MKGLCLEKQNNKRAKGRKEGREGGKGLGRWLS
jgi:hypothetical protein